VFQDKNIEDFGNCFSSLGHASGLLDDLWVCLSGRCFYQQQNYKPLETNPMAQQLATESKRFAKFE